MSPSGAVVDDRGLLDRVAAGDEDALVELHHRYAGVVFSFVSTRMSDRASAEEVAADVWLGCWRSARAFRGDSAVLTWLLGIAKRQIGAHTRRKRLPEVALELRHDQATAQDADPAGLVVSADGAGVLLTALRRLPPDLAEVVQLAWIHELAYDQIASVMGIPTGTVKSRIFRARALLQKQLRSNNE